MFVSHAFEDARDDELGEPFVGSEGFDAGFEVVSSSGFDEMNDMASLAQRFEVVGDRQIGSVVAAGFESRGNQIGILDIRQQFEADEINIRRRVADRTDHLASGPAVDIERTQVRFDFAGSRDRLEIRNRHRQKRDVDRLIDQRFM